MYVYRCIHIYVHRGIHIYVHIYMCMNVYPSHDLQKYKYIYIFTCKYISKWQYEKKKKETGTSPTRSLLIPNKKRAVTIITVHANSHTHTCLLTHGVVSKKIKTLTRAQTDTDTGTQTQTQDTQTYVWKTTTCVCVSQSCLHPKNPSLPTSQGRYIQKQLCRCLCIYRWCLNPKNPPLDISGAVYSKETELSMFVPVMLTPQKSNPPLTSRGQHVLIKKNHVLIKKKTIKTCSCVSTYWWCLHPKNPSPDISGAVFENQINSCAWIYQWCLHPKDPPSDISGAVCLKGKKR